MAMEKEEVGRIVGYGDKLSPCSLHHLPCSIAHNGPANVSAYFGSKSTGAKADGMEIQEAAFRGRRLLGSTLPLPQNHRGFVLEKAPSNPDDPDEWVVRSEFREITYWNHDTMPSFCDSLPRCIDWLNISASIHKPVTADQVASVLPIEEEAMAGKRKSEV
ncbi:ribonuclease H2 subunit C isoform X2 [Selaginella moellendorffii]|nr:ribonuclease H2 subunit C isoform X2 [Selaginella moellendorffii]|eukprot:XP_002969243.2 ribonuclease H2 subunit C isoform X2 [Selaginella moellendorffii]